MKLRSVFFSLLFLSAFLVPGKILADDEYSHVRIVRLSLVQGDVRFSRSAQDVAAEGPNAAWESAVANLPMREGFVVATDKGRAVVEFENGASAYLAEDSVLEFSQLGLLNGAFITHLKLTQGTATFYAHPGQSDEFIVESLTMSVSLGEKGSFRLDVAGDGGWVSVLSGHAQVISPAGTQQLDKDQMLVLHTGEATTASIERMPPADDFDKWVAGREETVTTATSIALQHASSPAYTAGFADLYSYGSWFPYQGMGSCWQPYGAGLGWTPFMSGMWMSDPAFGGWTWVSNEPWGWLPYHFGGWLYASNGWCWTPSGFGRGGYGVWRPVTAVWVGGTGTGRRPKTPRGLVPVHPLDRPGSTPINAAQGIIVPRVPGHNGAMGSTIARVNPGETLRVLNKPPRNFRHEEFVSTPAPPLAIRTMPIAGAANSRAASSGSSDTRAGAPADSRSSSIVFDPRQHAFVNNNASSPDAAAGESRPNLNGSGKVLAASPSGPVTSPRPTRTPGSTTAPSSTGPHTSSPPPSRPAPRSSGSSGGSGGAGSGHSSSGGGGWGSSSGGRSSGGSGGGGSSSGGGGRSSGGSSSGGRSR